MDVLASNVQINEGNTKPFHELDTSAKELVFARTNSVPIIKDEMIRKYGNFASYCKSKIIEEDLNISIKELILQECERYFPRTSIEKIAPGKLFEVCWLNVRLVNRLRFCLILLISSFS